MSTLPEPSPAPAAEQAAHEDASELGKDDVEGEEEEERVQDAVVEPPAPPAKTEEIAPANKKKRKDMTREEVLRDNRLRSKLRRLVQSERVSKFPQIEKLWHGTASEHQSLIDKWMENDGNEEKVESTIKLKVGLERKSDEIEEKLTIQQMKDAGFSRLPGSHEPIIRIS